MRGVSLRNAFVRLNTVEQIGRDGGKGCVCPFFRSPTLDGRRENSSREASMQRRTTSMWSAFRFPPRSFSKPFPLSTFLPLVPTVAPHGVVPLSFMVQDNSCCSRAIDAMDHGAGTTAACTALFSPRLPRGREGVSHRPSEGSGGETCACVSSSCGGPPHGRGPRRTPSRAIHSLPVVGRRSATPLAPSCGHPSCMRNAFHEPHRWRSSRTFSPSLVEQQRRHTGRTPHAPEEDTVHPHPEMKERRRGGGEAAAGDPPQKKSQAEQGMASSTVGYPRAAPSTSTNASPFLLPFPAIVKACRQGTLGMKASLAPSCVFCATRQQKKQKKKQEEEEEEGVSLPPPPAPDEKMAPHDPPWIASSSAFHSASHAKGRPASPLASSQDRIDRPWEKWSVTPQEEEETRVPLPHRLSSHSSFAPSIPHKRLQGGEKAPWQDGHSTRVPRATTPHHTSPNDKDDPLSWLSESDTASTAPHSHSGIMAEEEDLHGRNLPSTPQEEEEVGRVSSAVPVRVDHEAHVGTTEDSLSHWIHGTDASMHEWENDDPKESNWKRKQKDKQHKKKGKWWIFNRFSRRVVSASSPTLQDLSHLLGIGPCPLSRQLILQHPVAIQSFTRALQAKDLSWPAGWRSSEFFRLRRLLESTDASAVVPKVQAFLSETPPDASLRTSVLVSEKRTEEVEEAAPGQSRKDALTRDVRRPCRPNDVTEEDAEQVEKDLERRVADPVEDDLSKHNIPFSPSESSPMVPTIVKERLFSEADLTEEQRSVVELALRGHHLYIGGSAGTGKSVLLRVLRRRLGEEGLSVAVTATTGLAAYHIGGSTLHHRFGITLDGRFLRPKALQEYDVIIIDEVSMLSRIVFEELERQMRRVHRNALPFGGVQIILCGDFMQLGAISAPSLVQSPLFRHLFVMLKLIRSLRQEKNIGFYIHLQALRQGKMLPTWGRTVQFMDSYGHKNVLENFSTVPSEHEGGEKRNTSDSADAAPRVEKASPLSSSPSTPSLSSKVIFLPPLSSSSHLPEHLKDERDPLTDGTSSSSSSFFASSSSASLSTARPVTPPIIVEDAVNLLPTNALVRQANEVMLEKIEGEVVQFQSMALPPFLQGKWSPSYLLRVSPSASASRPPASWSSLLCYSSSPSTPEETSNPVSTVDRAALLHHLQRFVLSCLSPFSSYRMPPTSLDEAESGVEDDDEVDDKGSDVEEWQCHPERHMVLYPLYNDGFVFRVRLPSAWNGSPAKEAAFVSSLTDGLGDFLDTLDIGVHRGDVLPSGEGLHTDQDEFYLQQLTLRSPMAEPLLCKIGAKVMLRANLSRTLVNGSLGTIVGFVEMKKEELSSYLQHLLPSFRCHEGASEAGGVCHPYEASLEASIEQYADFLRFEHNFTTPLMPLVDFSGDGSTVPMAIPPVAFPVGGMVSTHYYAGGVLRLPLSLAYAFTVHKVQGLTLSGRVHLELSQMWPCEHLLYVAMSRVRDPDQLSVSNFRMDVVRVGADCLLFDRSLPSVDHAKILPHFIPAVWVTDPRKRKRLLQRQRGREKRRRKRENEEAVLSSFSVSQNGRRGRRQLARDIHVLQERALVKLHRKDLRAGHATL